MRVWRNFCCGLGDEEASGHAEVDDPLRGLVAREVEDDVLSDSSDFLDASAFECFDDQFGWRLQWFRFVAQPHGIDRVARNTTIDTVGDGFDFREFGHRSKFLNLKVSQNLEPQRTQRDTKEHEEYKTVLAHRSTTNHCRHNPAQVIIESHTAVSIKPLKSQREFFWVEVCELWFSF